MRRRIIAPIAAILPIAVTWAARTNRPRRGVCSAGFVYANLVRVVSLEAFIRLAKQRRALIELDSHQLYPPDSGFRFSPTQKNSRSRKKVLDTILETKFPRSRMIR